MAKRSIGNSASVLGAIGAITAIRGIFGTFLCTIVWLACVTATHAQNVASADDSCTQLLELYLADTRITSASVVAENSFVVPGQTQVSALPAFCRVVAVTSPAVNFEVWLPLSAWNGKYQGVGNGGMAGSIGYAAMATALRSGYATASTDTGHIAGPAAFDASWASGRPDLIEDFGHRALHLTTVNAKRLTEAFYQAPPDYSYFVGCSKGGQQGLMEAQRYPEDFDGIIAGDPAADWTRFYAGAHLWYSLALLDDEESYLPPAKLPALGAAVNAACDALDGIEDGILQNPLACDFDPASLTCSAGTDTDACLSPKQVAAVERIWSGVTRSSGELIFPGLVPGGEAAPGGWSTWVTGREPFSALHWLGGEGFFRWFVFDDADWDFRSFDFDADLEFALAKVGAAVDANDPDLRPFRDGGAKLIVYHGWSDPDISPKASIDYYEDVIDVIADETNLVERRAALDRTRDFFRLFMVPGMGHCRGGPGPDDFDPLTALASWVEGDIAPESMIAAKVVAGDVVRTRPICAYPLVAAYSGNGSTDEAASFHCTLP